MAELPPCPCHAGARQLRDDTDRIRVLETNLRHPAALRGPPGRRVGSRRATLSSRARTQRRPARTWVAPLTQMSNPRYGQYEYFNSLPVTVAVFALLRFCTGEDWRRCLRVTTIARQRIHVRPWHLDRPYMLTREHASGDLVYKFNYPRSIIYTSKQSKIKVPMAKRTRAWRVQSASLPGGQYSVRMLKMARGFKQAVARFALHLQHPVRLFYKERQDVLQGDDHNVLLVIAGASGEVRTFLSSCNYNLYACWLKKSPGSPLRGPGLSC